MKGSSKNSNISILKPFSIGFLISAVLLFVSFRPASFAATDVRDAMVKIYAVQNQPDYDNPWNMKGPESFSGSGCIIAGNRILTNAHVVSDHTYIQVRRYGQARKYQARLQAVSHEADLALLTVDEATFFEGVIALKFDDLPQVQQEVVVYGFPEGGDSLSTTRGVISRIEHQCYAHSLITLLAGQLDAAINPGNSGGPVVVGDRIVGVVMQSLKNSENIGYMVPQPIIAHFLTDMQDGRYDGFPDDGIIVQPMENQNLKKMHGLNSEQTGALVTEVLPNSAADGFILPGDVILSIDGHRVADDCTVEFRPKERTSSNYIIQQHQIGEKILMEILRAGRSEKITLVLNQAWGARGLVPALRYDVRPSFYIYGGLVFCPLTLNYMRTWGDSWTEEAPINLINQFTGQARLLRNEEVVIVSKVLASNVNQGYEDFTDERIVAVNERRIRNLRQLITAVENSKEDPYVLFKTISGRLIALDRQKVEAEHPVILQTYQIAADRSSDFKKPDGEEAGKIAAVTVRKLKGAVIDGKR
jgi:S1-C subfamily serine protease